MDLMGLILESVEPFVGHPERSLAVAVVFGVLAFASRRTRSRYRPLVFMAIAWAAFGLYEAEATRRQANIRIDLLASWPALVLITVIGLFRWIRVLTVSSKAGVAAAGGLIPTGLVLVAAMVAGALAIMRYGTPPSRKAGSAAPAGQNPGKAISSMLGAFRVSGATLAVAPSEFAGGCPVTVRFTATINWTGRPGVVKMRWRRSDGFATEPVTVGTDAQPLVLKPQWSLGERSGYTFSGWQVLEILEPVLMQSNLAQFKVTCM